MSSASTTTSAATRTIHGKLYPDVAGMATVFALVTSASVNLPVIQSQSHNRGLTRSPAVISFLLIATGLVVLVAREGIVEKMKKPLSALIGEMRAKVLSR